MLVKASRIALAQTTSILGDVKKNVQRHVKLAERAAEKNADAIIFQSFPYRGILYAISISNVRCGPILNSSNP